MVLTPLSHKPIYGLCLRLFTYPNNNTPPNQQANENLTHLHSESGVLVSVLQVASLVQKPTFIFSACAASIVKEYLLSRFFENIDNLL